MLPDGVSQIKAARARKAIAERLEQLRKDRNEEMDLWPDDAPYIADAFARLAHAVEESRVPRVAIYRSEAA